LNANRLLPKIPDLLQVAQVGGEPLLQAGTQTPGGADLPVPERR